MRHAYPLILLAMGCFVSSVRAQPTFGEPIVISEARLEAPRQLRVADVDSDGRMDLFAVGRKGGMLYRFPALPGGGFGTLVPVLDVGPKEAVFELADLDADGDPDLVVAARATSTLTWYPNDGTGRFGDAKVVSEDAIRPRQLVATDVDADGDLDLAVVLGGMPLKGTALGWKSQLEWFVNDGKGDFGPVQVVRRQQGTVDPQSEATYDDLWRAHFVDLDADGDQDLVLGHRKHIVEAYRNTDGVFSMIEILVEQSNTYGSPIVSEDVDGDGDPDLVLDDYYAVWYQNGGSGQFERGDRLNDSSKWLFIVGDLNLDGRLDALQVGSKGEQAIVLDVVGSEPTQVPIHVSPIEDLSYVSSRQFIDLDGDGYRDLLVSSWEEDIILWARNQMASGEAGGLGPIQVISRTDIQYPWQPALADVDADGDTDVVLQHGRNRISWLENGGAGQFGPGQSIARLGGGVGGLGVGDLNSDDLPDVVFSESTSGFVARQMNLGFGRFSEPVIIDSLYRYLGDIQFGDVNQDGDMDVLATSGDEQAVFWYRGDGSGGLESRRLVAALPGSPSGTLVRDLDGDGDIDALATFSGGSRSGSSGAAWYENNGIGAFTEHPIVIDASAGAYTPVLWDWDRDGDADLVIGARFGLYPNERRILWWFTSDGRGHFSAPVQTDIPEDTYVSLLYVADLGDGQERLLGLTSQGLAIVGRSVSDSTLVLEPLELGRASPPRLSYVLLGDLNGDEATDVFAFNDHRSLVWYPSTLVVSTDLTRIAGEGLSHPVPNPFSASSTVAFTAEVSGPARATLHDALGRQLDVLYDGLAQMGQSYELAIDGAALAPGVYWVRLETETASSTRSLVRVR